MVFQPTAASVTCQWIAGPVPFRFPQIAGDEMKIIRVTKRLLLFVILGLAVPGAFGAGTEITKVDATPDGDGVRINIELTSPARPLMRLADNPSRLILLFQNVSSPNLPRRLQINLGGVSEI